MAKSLSLPNIRLLTQDPEFSARLISVALPIMVQNFIMSSLNMVGTLMIGQLGETAVASAGLANQVFFLVNLMLFGITSGSAIFIAQFWGKGDQSNIHKVLGLCLLQALLGSALFLAVAMLAPRAVLGFYTRDPAVIAAGSEYLRLLAPSFIFTAVSFSFAAALRSTGNVKTPLYISMFALSLSTVVSFTLIFGHFGLPRLGVKGAAAGALVARIVECLSYLWAIYRRKSFLAASLPQLFGFDRRFAGQVLRRALPVTFNEMLWSFGFTTYYAVYARIGTEAIAAMNIASTIENLVFVFFIGLSNGTAILVGNRIGAGEEEKAFRYAGRSLLLAFLGSVVLGTLIFFGAGQLLALYKVSPIVITYAQNIFRVMGLTQWIRMMNMVNYVGVLRSGGDTRFAFLIDIGVMWGVGVPLAFLGAFVLHLPVYWVYPLILTEELVKWTIAMARFLSRKWINNLAHSFG
jgi:putative MATE family efflux protein